MEEIESLSGKVKAGSATNQDIERFGELFEVLAEREFGGVSIAEAPEVDVAAARRKVWARIRENEGPSSESILQRFRFGWVAAAFIAVALVGGTVMKFLVTPATDEKSADITVLSGKRHIVLKDGTTVDLNEGSSLSYRPDFGAEERVVVLDGEGFFDVAHDPKRPFKVKAGGITTTVLGTMFVIRAYSDQDDVSVSVERGKVSIASEDKDFGVLAAHERVVYKKRSKNVLKDSGDMSVASKWRSNFFVLDNVSMEEAIDKISAHFGVKITLKDSPIWKCRVNLSFVEGEDVHQVMNVIAAVNQAKLEISGMAITISGGLPCSEQ